MNRIDRDAARAFWSGTRFSRNNTKVTVYKNIVVRLYLHGNLIAIRRTDRGWVMVTLAGWNTPTTRARLNAVLARLGAYISQGQGVPYIIVNDHKQEMKSHQLYQVLPGGPIHRVYAESEEAR